MRESGLVRELAGNSIEKFHDSALKRILRPYDHQAFTQNQLLQNFRPMSQVIRRQPNVGANGTLDQQVPISRKLGVKQRLH